MSPPQRGHTGKQMLQQRLGIPNPLSRLPLDMPRGALRQGGAARQSLEGPCAGGEGLAPAGVDAGKGSRSHQLLPSACTCAPAAPSTKAALRRSAAGPGAGTAPAGQPAAGSWSCTGTELASGSPRHLGRHPHPPGTSTWSGCLSHPRLGQAVSPWGAILVRRGWDALVAPSETAHRVTGASWAHALPGGDGPVEGPGGLRCQGRGVPGVRASWRALPAPLPHAAPYCLPWLAAARWRL